MDKTAMEIDTIKSRIKDYILEEFLPGEDPKELTDTTELMTLGVLDSVSVMQLVTFLEDNFKITLEANEMGAEHMNTLTDITELVSKKCSA